MGLFARGSKCDNATRLTAGIVVMWLDKQATEEHLKTWVKHSPTPKLVTTIDGKILWANAAFCEWSQYTLNELKGMTWMQITVPDENLEADIKEAQNLDAYNPRYTVKKQYIPKGSKPEWGHLTIIRYPLVGQVECCLCTWEPLKNGTATAFTTAMEHYEHIAERLEQMTAEIRTVSTQTDEDKFVLGAIRMIQRHPKIAAGFIIIALSIFGLNNVVELLQRTGLIQIPVKVEKTEGHAHVAYEIGSVADSAEYRVVTPAGTQVQWSGIGGRRVGPVSVAAGRGGRSSGRSGSGIDHLGRQDDGIDAMPNGKHVTF